MKVIVTDEISEKGLELLQKDPRVQLDVRLGLRKAELHQLIGDYDAIITRSGTQVDAELLGHAKKLKMVARAGVGIDNVDVPAASERGIIVVNAPFGNTNSAAEHSMAILLAMCRNVPLAGPAFFTMMANALCGLQFGLLTISCTTADRSGLSRVWPSSQ